MANEVSITASLKYASGKASAALSTTFQADQTGNKYEAGVQIIGTTEEQLQKNDVGTIGFLGARNMDATNFVELGSSTGNYSVKLKPGQGCVLPWGYSAVYAKADTAAVNVEYVLVEA